VKSWKTESNLRRAGQTYRAVWRKRQGGFKQSHGGESQWGLVNVLVFFWLLFGFETKIPALISIFKPIDDKCKNQKKSL
jgi:hypothetical protein